VVGSNAWAKAQAYLRGKCNSKCNSNCNSNSKNKNKNKSQCGDLSAAAAKSAAFGRDDSILG